METKPLVEWTARQIRDPLLRLQFLQATAPRILRRARPKPYKRACLAAATGILLAVVVFFAQPARGSHQTNRNQANMNQADMVLPAPTAAPVRVPANPEIWLVETTEDAEAYSNGLRVETRFAVANRPRSFRAFPVAHPEDTLGSRARNRPALCSIPRRACRPRLSRARIPC